jgi:hypothetical protein
MELLGIALARTVAIPFTGGCACGAIRYECLALPLRMLNCHCRDCQLAGGSGFSPSLIMARGAVSLTKGQPAHFEKIADSGKIAKREFCFACGSPLFASSSAAVEYLALRASSLDDPSWFRPEANVWAASAQPWDYLDPAIPKFERGRPSVERQESDAARLSALDPN